MAQISREVRRIYDKWRSRNAVSMRRKGKTPNGNIGWHDDPGVENMVINSRRNYRRHRQPMIETQSD